MQDHELKDTLQKLDVPLPPDGAKERAINLAKQAFIEKQQSRQGMAAKARPISTTALWEQLIRSLTMKKAYVFAGSFAAVAVVLAITTTHYSTIMQPAIIPLPAETKKAEPVATDPQTHNTDEAVGVSVANPNAPGMQMGAIYAPQLPLHIDPPLPSPEHSQVNQAAPGMAGAAAPAPVMRERAAAAESMSASKRMATADRAGSTMPYPHPQPSYYSGGDKFESHAANEIKSVAAEPVSTFSIDVDTASYSFVRRMLTQGQLPQPEMVRVEEMINYFDYSYPLPKDKSEPFAPSVAVVPSPWNTATKLVHVGIKGFSMEDRPRTNLVFLIDVSGSMNAPDKLPLLKSSLKMLLDQLHPDDTIGIVTYAGYAGTALTPTKVADKQKIIAVVDQLHAGGGTAGGEGIRKAYDLVGHGFNREAINRVILATDGDFNVGITDPAQLTGFVEEQRRRGITLSILGFGRGNYNDSLMQKLAQNGNGNAAYIDTLNEARKVLVNEVASTLFTIATDVKIQVEWNPAMVSSYRLIGYESRRLKREDFNNDKVDAGDIGSGHEVTAIYEITPAAAPGSVDEPRYGAGVKEPKPSAQFSGEYGFLKMRYKLPGSDSSKLITTPINMSVEVPAIEQASEDVRFAVAVAGFGQLLKGSPHLSGYSFSDVVTLAAGALGADTFGYRKEFLDLVQSANHLKSGRPYYNQPCIPGMMCD